MATSRENEKEKKPNQNKSKTRKTQKKTTVSQKKTIVDSTALDTGQLTTQRENGRELSF
jgi:hypothetical protein